MYSNADFDTNLSSDLVAAAGLAEEDPGGGTTYGLKSFVTNRASCCLDPIGVPTADVADYRPASVSTPTLLKTASTCNLTVPSGGDVRLTNFVGQGRSAERIASAGVVQFDLADLPVGTYVVEVQEAGLPVLRTHVVIF